MRTFLYLLLVVCFSVYSQTDSTKLTFVAYWEVGDSYNFKISKSKKEWRDQELIKNDSSQYIANFKVLEATATSYTIQWSYTDQIVDTYQKKALQLFDNNETLLELFKKMNFQKVIYQTDEFGEIKSILNSEKASKSTQFILAEMLNSFKNRTTEKIEELNYLFEPIFKLYSNSETVQNLILKEISNLHFLLGYEIDIQSPIEYEQEFSNIINDKPLYADAKLSFKEIDFENNSCIIEENIHLKEESFKEAIKDFLLSMKQETTSELINKSIFDVHEKNEYQLYFNPGIPYQILKKRTLNLQVDSLDVLQEEIFKLELISNL
nr:hypothetical protein [uncultured Flavobacterium sp.]